MSKTITSFTHDCVADLQNVTLHFQNLSQTVYSILLILLMLIINNWIKQCMNLKLSLAQVGYSTEIKHHFDHTRFIQRVEIFLYWFSSILSRLLTDFRVRRIVVMGLCTDWKNRCSCSGSMVTDRSMSLFLQVYKRPNFLLLESSPVSQTLHTCNPKHSTQTSNEKIQCLFASPSPTQYASNQCTSGRAVVTYEVPRTSQHQLTKF